MRAKKARSHSLVIFVIVGVSTLLVYEIYAQSTIPITFQITDNSIGTSKLQNASVTSTKLANKSVTYEKIDTSTAVDGYVLKYSAADGTFRPLPEAGAEGATGLTSLAIGNGLVGEGTLITTSGTLNVDIGTGAGQVVGLDSNANINTKNVLAIDHSPNFTGYLSLRDSVSSSDFRFFTAGSLKLIYTDNYVSTTDLADYDVALEVEDDGDIKLGQDLSVGGQLTVNGVGVNSYTLPATRGAANQYLTSDGLGGTTWTTPTPVGNGTVTSVIAGTGLTGGTITITGTLAVDTGTTAGKIVVVDAGNKIASSLVPSGINAANIGTGVINNTEFASLNGVSANINTQFLNLVTTYQPLDANLTALAAITPTNDYFLVGNGGAWIKKSPSEARLSLSLGSMATQSQSSVSITGGSINDTVIGGTTPAAIFATSVVADSLAVTTLNATNLSTTGNASIDGKVVASFGDKKAAIGKHSGYAGYAAFWQDGNTHYNVLADATHVFLNANSASGNVYLRAANTNLAYVEGANGNMTITGSLSIPSGQKLTVHGNDVINTANSWLRTYNGDGWYSQTHGGGWHMTDTTWLRAYNDKKIYTAGNEIRAKDAIIGVHATYGDNYSAFWRNGLDYAVLTNGSNTYINAPIATGSIYFRFANANAPSAMELEGTFGDLYLNIGTAYKPGGGAWVATSDARLKDVHGPYPRGLAEIRKVNPIEYNYKKNNPKKYPSDKTHQGVVAQEIKKVFPESVSLDRDGYYVFNSDPVWWASVNAIKELDLMIQKNLQQYNLMHEGLLEQTRKLASLEDEAQMLSHENMELQRENQEIKQFLCDQYADAPFCLHSRK